MTEKIIAVLIEQIKVSNNNSKLSIIESGNKTTIVNFPCNNISTILYARNRIDFVLDDYVVIEKKALIAYLKPRFKKIEDCRFFFNNKINLYLDKAFENNNLGVFYQAMWVFEILNRIKMEFEGLSKLID